METSEVCIFASQLRTRALSSAGSERLPYKQRVGGSNPSAPTPKFLDCFSSENIGRLAQLVQSVCLTSRGSGVRIPQRPHRFSRFRRSRFPIGRLAQLVQSVCLTSRGSGVRIPQRPLPRSNSKGCFFFCIYHSHCFFLAQKSL